MGTKRNGLLIDEQGEKRSGRWFGSVNRRGQAVMSLRVKTTAVTAPTTTR